MSSNQGNKFRVVGGSKGDGSASSARTDGAGLKPLLSECPLCGGLEQHDLDCMNRGGPFPQAPFPEPGLKPLSIDELFEHMRSLRLQMLNRELEECQAHQRLLWATYNEHCKKEFRLMSSINALEGVQPDLFS